MSVDVYLAGPMTGYPDFNYPLFVSISEVLKRTTGCHVVHTANTPRNLEDREYHELSERYLSQCDCIAFLPDWNESIGATAEFRLAYKQGIPAFFLPDDMRELEAHIASGGSSAAFMADGIAYYREPVDVAAMRAGTMNRARAALKRDGFVDQEIESFLKGFRKGIED